MLDTCTLKHNYLIFGDLLLPNQTEEKLPDREELYRTLATNFTQVSILLFNHQLRHAIVDGAGLSAVGLTQEMLEGKTIWDIFPDTICSEVESAYRAALTGKTTRKELIYSEHNYILQTLPVHNEYGEILGGMAMMQDITERKQAEENLEKSLSLLRATLESTADGIVAVSLKGEVIGFNQRFIQMWQISDPDIIMTSLSNQNQLNFLFDQLKYPDIFVKRVEELYKQPETKAYDILELKNGKIFERYSLPQILSGEIIGRVWSFRDITEQKRTEEALRNALERERLLGRIMQRIRQSLDLHEILNRAVVEVRNFLEVERVVLYRLESHKHSWFVVESIAPEADFLVGVSLNEKHFQAQYIQKYNSGDVFIIHDVTDFTVSEEDQKILMKSGIKAHLLVPIIYEEEVWGIICVHQCSSCRHWEQFEIEFLQHLSTQLAIAIQQSSLVKKLQEANQELERLASIDGLTQLANRRRFDEYLNQEWRRMARNKTELSLILCDIDCFKIYNDTYGHQAGDDCLRQVAGALNLAVNRPGDLVARYGGEEFAFILPNTTSIGAAYIAKSIHSMVKDLEIVHVMSPVSPFITISLGVATVIPTHNTSFSSLITAADVALYQAKAQGRNQTVIGNGEVGMGNLE